MAKALTQSDVTFEAERWASTTKKLNAAEAAREAEIAPLTAQYDAAVAEINKRHDPGIGKLQTKADEHQARVIGWLETKKKTTTLEGKNWIAEIVHGLKQSPRRVDLAKLTELCKKKGVELFAIATVVLKEADKLLGRKEVDAISTHDDIPTKTVSLKLKD